MPLDVVEGEEQTGTQIRRCLEKAVGRRLLACVLANPLLSVEFRRVKRERENLEFLPFGGKLLIDFGFLSVSST